MDRKTEIIEAAAKIMGSDGIQAFTTKRLGSVIGISEAALYRHFQNKETIIHSVFDYFEKMIAQKISDTLSANKSSKAKIEEVFQLHKQIFQEYPELVFLLFSEGSFIDVAGLGEKIKVILHHKFEMMQHLINEGQKHGEIRTDIDAYELGKMIMGYFRMYLLELRLEGNMDNLDTYCAAFFKTLNKLL